MAGTLYGAHKREIVQTSVCLVVSAILGVGVITVTQALSVDTRRFLPWYSVTGLAIGFLLTIALLYYRGLDLFSPWVLFPLVYLAYYLIGSLNVSTYRREVDAGTLFPVVYLGLAGFVAGVLVAKLFPMARKLVRPSRELDLPGIWNVTVPFYLIGVVSLVLIVWKNGIPLLGGITQRGLLLRATVSPILEELTRLMWISSAVYIITVYHQTRSFDKKSLLLMMVTPLLVVPLGYRGTIVIFAVVVMVAAFHIRRPTLLLVGVVLVFIAVGSYLIWIVRYSIEGTMDIGTMARMYDFPIENSFVFYLYRLLREAVSHTSGILSSVDDGSFLGGRLFVADLLTILPGRQQSGPMMMGQLLHGSGVAGLTVSIVAGLYFDFGRPGVVIGLFVVGLVCMTAYRRMLHSMSVTSVVLYSIIMAESLHYLNRGVFSTNYVWDVLVALCICKIVESKTVADKREGRTLERAWS